MASNHNGINAACSANIVVAFSATISVLQLSVLSFMVYNLLLYYLLIEYNKLLKTDALMYDLLAHAPTTTFDIT